MWYVYIAECHDKALYTGITDNLERRFNEHRQSKGGHYTAYNRPQRILYKEPFEDKLEAESREQQIKRWSRTKKLALIQGDKERLVGLSRSRDGTTF
ncbi:MAG: GIY-YIG nuclease family protein [Candidatus Omnitrophica bacterium]|nr:GIY-YIG nuclease family protein [Candidatus Omnitrophota bacterium]